MGVELDHPSAHSFSHTPGRHAPRASVGPSVFPNAGKQRAKKSSTLEEETEKVPPSVNNMLVPSAVKYQRQSEGLECKESVEHSIAFVVFSVFLPSSSCTSKEQQSIT